MPKAELETDRDDAEQEAARLAALVSTGILDSEPEPSYDAIARLAAEYFQADAAFIGFGDESRVWIKSHWGTAVRELPRKDSIFERVLAEDGPVIVSNSSKRPQAEGQLLVLKVLDMPFFASVPVRSFDGKILGLLLRNGSRRAQDARKPG